MVRGVAAVSDPRVLVTSRSFSSGDVDCAGRLTTAGAVVVDGPMDHDLERLRSLLPGCVAWIAGTPAIRAEHLDLGPDLRLVARYGVGYDAVDLAATDARGIMVTNTPGANSDSVADHALALVLGALRGLVQGDRDLRAGDWSTRRTRELGSLTVGIVGFGRIGRSLAARLAGFGSPVLAVDPMLSPDDVRAAGAEPADLAGLAGAADVVSLHAPGGQVVVDRDWLRNARPGLIVVNTARAGLVDEDAVAEALREGRIAFYAADTVSGEGSPGAGGPLLAADLADQVLLTPHRAAQTVEAVDRMGSSAVDAVLAVLAGRRPDHVVSDAGGTR